MDTFILPIIFVWSARIALNILTYAQLWWVKEYRSDRMIIHLRTPQGRRLWWPAWRRPPISPKTMLLVLMSLGVSGYLIWAIALPLLLRFVLVDMLSFPMTWILVLMLNAPTRLCHNFLIAMAVRKLGGHKPMTVVGITGSYGKTSTKDYLAIILSSTFRVLKTEASKNSPIGIAEVILKSLNPEHEVFVVEMGAYNIGEITKMVAMVKPQVGIVTSINPQHQDLFGTLENTMKAKYELIDGLVGRRISIFNADNDRTKEMAVWAKRDGCDVWWFTRRKNAPNRRDRVFMANDIHADFNGIEFSCVVGGKKAPVAASVVGAHQSETILGAIACAVACGMSLEEAATAAGAIRPTPKVLEVVAGVNGSTFINDTLNNNPDAAKAALDVLAWSKGTKILVFQPMVELGKYAAESHEMVGAYAARIADEIFLTNSNNYDDFIRGVRRISDTVRVSVASPHKAALAIRDTLGKSDAVLFKGKEAEHVFRAI